MQVVDDLAAFLVAVDDQPVAALGDAFLLRQFPRHDHHVTDEFLVVLADVVDGGDFPVRDDQDMYRRRRRDVNGDR